MSALRRAVGAAVLVALGAGALPACGVLGGGGGTYEITAFFPRAVSVFEASDVRVLGLQAGSVKEVEVQGDRVKVVMAVDDDVPVPDDLTAQIVPQSLIGERYIQLSPAFKEGMQRAEDGKVIDDLEHIIVPTEPDEALAALKEFLDSLDPNGLGRLVTNLEEDLRGNGTALNEMLGSLSDLVGTFAEKDDALVRIVDSFDKLTSTLVTRESQLGQVLDAFAEASQVLADERQGIEALVAGLADLSSEGLSLVSEHDADLRAGIQTLTDAAAVIEANLEAVDDLLESGGLLAPGLIGAFNEELRAVNLRNNFSPLVPELLDLVLGALGLPSMCIPILTECTVQGAAGAGATSARLAPTSPIGSLVALLEAPTEDRAPAGPGWLERTGGFLRDAGDTLLGTGG
jgi:phospholipid/cholesterol/gamma-HCH transport system substrate-binding protein